MFAYFFHPLFLPSTSSSLNHHVFIIYHCYFPLFIIFSFFPPFELASSPPFVYNLVFRIFIWTLQQHFLETLMLQTHYQDLCSFWLPIILFFPFISAQVIRFLSCPIIFLPFYMASKTPSSWNNNIFVSAPIPSSNYPFLLSPPSLPLSSAPSFPTSSNRLSILLPSSSHLPPIPWSHPSLDRSPAPVFCKGPACRRR